MTSTNKELDEIIEYIATCAVEQKDRPGLTYKYKCKKKLLAWRDALIKIERLEAQRELIEWLDDNHQTDTDDLGRSNRPYSAICYPAQPIFDKRKELSAALKAIRGE